MEKVLYRLDELQAAGLPFEKKTLQNNLNLHTQCVEFPGLPPLRTLKIGKFRCVTAHDFESWMRAAGMLPAQEPAPQNAAAAPRKSGRPRRAGAIF
ncbi:MAG: hypothetical protein AB7S55_02940 [Thiomonas sp.]|jgi:hypothetical protein